MIRRLRQTISQKAGIILPVRHFGKRLVDEGFSCKCETVCYSLFYGNIYFSTFSASPISLEMQIILATAVQDITAELLYLSAEEALANGSKKITPRAIRNATNTNPLFSRLFRKIYIPRDPCSMPVR